MVIIRRKIPSVPNQTTLVERLLAAYKRADADTIYEGQHWYDGARREAERLASMYGFHVSQTAYVLAALSPNVAWRDNIVSAEHACRQYREGEGWMGFHGAGYGKNKAKAEQILTGRLEALSGPKVTRFAEAILGNEGSCTVDMWMIRACGFSDKTASTHLIDAIRAAIHTAAPMVNETVRDFQAIVWIQVRNRDNDGGQTLLWHRSEENAA